MTVFQFRDVPVFVAAIPFQSFDREFSNLSRLNKTNHHSFVPEVYPGINIRGVIIQIADDFVAWHPTDAVRNQA